jgi:hypothetical protein
MFAHQVWAWPMKFTRGKRSTMRGKLSKPSPKRLN